MQIFHKNTDDLFLDVSKVFKGYILSLHQTWPETQKLFFVVHVS